MRASLNQRLKNALQHHLRLLQRLVIPEPNHSKPRPREAQRPLQILDHRLRMLSTIELHDQPSADAHEVDDVSTNRHLPPESIAAQPPMAQVVPETPFGIRRVQAQSARVCEE